MSNELNNLDNEIFHCIDQLKKAIRLIRLPVSGPHVLITFIAFLEV